MPPAEDAEVCGDTESRFYSDGLYKAIYAKAVKAEVSKDFDSAFRLYIKAAEAFLHLSRSVTREREKSKASAKKALERAEKIKAFVEKSKSTPNGPDPQLTPVGIDYFSPQEQSYVLGKGGFVNGRLFPLWDLPFHTSTDTLHEDPDGELELSPEQLKVSPVWHRPPDWPIGQDCSPLRPQDILQHIITDCSLCASLSVCLEHAQRFNTPVCLFSCRKGSYELRLFFNGAWRRVIIDDRLPYHPATDTLVCMTSTIVDGHGAIWPSLVEKGYMKLMGGYDFPGSNSSIDLRTLVGWVPEHLQIQSPSFKRETTWTRIVAGFRTGQCMLTLGTGTNPDIIWQGTRLLPSHSYAVIDVTEEDAIRGLTVLDSWTRALDEGAAPRMIQVPWADVLQVFESIYLSWDPNIWPNHLTFHGLWKQARPGDQRSTRCLELKFDNASADEELCLLLSRHVADTQCTSDFISLAVQLQDGPSAGYESKIVTKGSYTNSTHALACTQLPSHSSGTLSVSISYDGQTPEVGFSLSAYAPSMVNIAWNEKVTKPPFTSKVEGALTSKNSGGNSTHPTFMVNPQYHLRIHPPKQGPLQKANISLTMQMGREVPVNVAVAWSQGGRVFTLSEKDLAATSGAYSYGLAKLTKSLQVGDYSVILSAFEPNTMGTFSLEVESSLPFDLRAIPQEGAGMYAKTIRGAWDPRNAMGGPSFKQYSQNPRFEIDVQALTELKVRLQLLKPKTTAGLNLTIFHATTGALGPHITTSGGYDDSVTGVVTPQISLGAGKYWAIPSSYHPGFQNAFELIVYSTSARVKVAEIR
ncbi:hypothetical protein FB45DRAFT_730213 [Roridomyces roridus]|uniref:Calpain catalytic domain-containing protein n=1 Tax=Roridomyces roridus TaxID=1738132 RepID=A0AAD7G2C7_9AGAR|nr:hypothetical protein FB45DRAFT_730213 [Roridomyces roridus]